MGRYLTRNGKNRESVVLAAFEKEVPIFGPGVQRLQRGLRLECPAPMAIIRSGM